jgi:D-3-phosphoglycerate dehydrogenase
MPKSKILFVDTCHLVLEEFIDKSGCEVVYIPDALTKHEINLSAYIGLIVRSKKVTAQIIDRMPNLKFIGRVGAGLENIDVTYAESKGVQCFNSPEGSRHTVGEHAVGLLLSVMNKISKADAEVKNGIWDRDNNWGIEIKDKTIGIIGYGNMGSAFAEKISGFGVKVIAYDKYKFNYSDEFVQEAKMEQLFEECDIFSLHVPLTEETRFMVNSEYLNEFKKNIFLINTARGKVLETNDLVQAIESGKILGAGLDVLEYEKSAFEKLDIENLPESLKYLFNSDKVVLTPHVAGWTHESYYKLAKVIFEKVKGLL